MSGRPDSESATTVLVPMGAAGYGVYLERAIGGYAEENVTSGRWPKEGALERSQADFARLLPWGIETPDNYLFEIRMSEDGPTIGYLWYAVEEKQGVRSAFVYDVEILPPWRRLGHAMRAFRVMELLVASSGIFSIGLHVFNHNTAAQALYAKLGYTVTSLNMMKHLGKPVGGLVEEG